MGFQQLLELLIENEEFQTVRERLAFKETKQAVFGLVGSLRSFWWGALGQEAKGQYLIITTDELSGKKILRDLTMLVKEEDVLFFSPKEFVPYQVYARSREVDSERLATLNKLIRGKPRFVITTPEAFCQKLIPKEEFAQFQLHLTRGQELERDDLMAKLAKAGYERVDLVEAPGQFAVRGSLVDIYPPNLANPLRVDFFDDEIDSLGYFDGETQRTLEGIKEAFVGPAKEMLLPRGNHEQALTYLREEWAATIKRLEKVKNRGAIQALNEKMEKLIVHLEEGLEPEGLEPLQPFFYPEQDTIIDYFATIPTIILDEPNQLWERWLRYEQERGETMVQLLETGGVLPGQAKLYQDALEIKGVLDHYALVAFSSLPQRMELVNPQHIVSIQASGMHPFLGKMDLVKDEIKRWKEQHNAIVFVMGSKEQAQQLQDLLFEEEIEGMIVENFEGRFYPGQIRIMVGDWQQGFHYPAIKLALITEEEVFGQRRIRRTKAKPKEGRKITAFTDLKEGDYVVHNQHGIGKYLGVQRLEVGGVYKDYLNIQYNGADRLYVPTDQIHLIQKYIGAEGQSPRLNKLGGTEWTRVKSRVKASVKDMADELIKLYASREKAIGYSFSQDTPWQQEFETQFPYTETPDQLQAILEIKQDMEKPKPMDRLLCGDVGYGKTEVALRGAFKAVNDGKQVAVLVPTTVLAQQHYNTFRERMGTFPITIGLLSRFRTPKEQTRVIQGLKEGTVDLVIGTHRLLSNDVVFKDLGLVIIDEEQRFGVAHKEKLKQFRQSVDVLTLTATPIPRTLHMALSGVRDMSTIETPPEDRYPVQTYVVERHPDVIRDAIRRELGRGGQVYFIHNRIADLEKVALEVQSLVPDARVTMAHGQMREADLEEKMLGFIEGEYDVLVCTTIIENGLDIPNVNTLIVDDADHLGLAQLYQIRGRVGRSNRVAHAYFTFRPNKIISQVAQKRLSAIREFTEFGSGFKIAMRDLEIRGAGNLLGPEQHGQILAVGFDLYCRLLEDAVGEAMGTTPQEEKEIKKTPATVELAVHAYLPDEYMGQSSFKMEMYRRLAEATTLAEIDEVDEELWDRFGEPPIPAKNLIRIASIRVTADTLGIKKISQSNQETEIEAGEDFPLQGEKLMFLAQEFPRRLSFSTAGGLTIKLRTQETEKDELLEQLERLLEKMKNLASLKVG